MNCSPSRVTDREGRLGKAIPWTLGLCAASLIAFALLFSSSAASLSHHHLRKLQKFWTSANETGIIHWAASKATLDTAKHLDGGISKIIHQSWRSEEVPEKFQSWAQTWRTNHPDWSYVLWTDESNRNLVAEHFPHLLPVYDAFPEAIIRADTARILYMKQYGGCYADLDFESLKPLDPLLRDLPIALAKMGHSDPKSVGEIAQHSIPNAFMCSSPGHPYWDFALRHIVEKVAREAVVTDSNWDHVEQTAGPGMLHAACEDWTATIGEAIPLLPPESIYPYDWTLT
ncbi:hypothetical protein WJX84_001856, partial [Apatococcus fuscideae]